MNLQEIKSHPEVVAIRNWAAEALEEALELPEYDVPRNASDIERDAASPTAWVGVLEYKKLSKVLTNAELDLYLDNY